MIEEAPPYYEWNTQFALAVSSPDYRGGGEFLLQMYAVL